MKIAICASEVAPFAKTGGLADVAGALPSALSRLGEEVIVIMPRYKSIDEKKFSLRRLGSNISFAQAGDSAKVYFIDNDAYFGRDGLYQDKAGDYADNLERFTFYCRRTLELLREISFRPDIIHVHDWQASLVPVYLKTICRRDCFYSRTRTMLTIHNIGYQGLFPKEKFPLLGLDWDLFNIDGLEFYGKINLLKGGITFADLINTVSPTYAREIMTGEFGFGLEGVLRKRSGSVYGILNGLDGDIWDPKNDKYIHANFSHSDLSGKAKDKYELKRLCNLSGAEGAPLIGIVSRLAQQKGFDILLESIDEICKIGAQLVILGVGDVKYQKLLKKAEKKYPKAISFNFKFDDPLAHKIYAGSDIFLMPSLYEPCGLGQMIALRYGTIPVVFKTGGLADTVTSANGFVFDSYDKAGLVNAVKKAVDAYSDKGKWHRLMAQGMQSDFSWEASAKEYLKLYEKAKKK